VNELSFSFCSQLLALSFNKKEKCHRQIPLVDTSLNFDGVTFLNEFAKMQIGVVWGVSAKLVPLHKCDKVVVELKVVSLNRKANNGWGNALHLR